MVAVKQQEIEVIIDGKKFAGWDSLNVTRALGTLCGDFSFNLFDFPIASTKDINPGSEVLVTMTGKPLSHNLITGYIDRVTRKKTSDSTSLEFAGRDKTSDLIDCSALYKNSSWRKKNMSEICKDICNPFDIIVTLGIDDIQINNFALQSGETAFDAMERLARANSVLLLTDELGRLKLSKIGTKKTSVQLEVGRNIKSLTLEEDHSGRYSRYFARGQGKGNGNQWTNDIVSIKKECIDAGVGRYRPYVFMTEKHMTATEIQKRVNWESQVRAGRAIRCMVAVQGWLQDPTDKYSFPWTINEIVNVRDRAWGIDADLVISSVSFLLDGAGGRVSNLGLSPPEIFASEPGERIELASRSSIRPKRTNKNQKEWVENLGLYY